VDIREEHFPLRGSRPTPELVHQLRVALTAFIVGHTRAVNTYTFYDVLDEYVGPWGDQGYPLAYGKYYNVLFNQNTALQNNPETRDWIRKTTILLQEALRDFVVRRFEAGTLASLTEPELRAAAFESHPIAYTHAGLAKVLLTEPRLIGIVASIPYKEYSPVTSELRWNDTFTPTVRQVFVTIGITAPESVAWGLVALMPVHSGLLQRAAAMDQRELMRTTEQNRELSLIREPLVSGRCDNIVWLNAITDRLTSTEYSERPAAREANEIVGIANARKHEVARYYRARLKERPEMRTAFDRAQPGWDQW